MNVYVSSAWHKVTTPNVFQPGSSAGKPLRACTIYTAPTTQVSCYTAFTPTTVNCTGAAITIPSGTSQVILTSNGAGGGGGVGSGATAGGRGGTGGSSTRTLALASGDWGLTIADTLGVGGTGHPSSSTGNGSAGTGNTTMSGTVAAGTFNLVDGPGGAGLTGGQNGASGTASGGTSNVPGGNNPGGNGGFITISAGLPGTNGSCSAAFS